MQSNNSTQALMGALGEQNVLALGRAGTGKSVLLRNIEEMAGDGTIIAAPTGISAINVGGDTCNSLFKLPNCVTPIEGIEINSPTKRLFSKRGPVKRIIFDEIGMVRSDRIVQIDHILKTVRQSPDPFGGLQVICIGDFLQLSVILQREERFDFQNSYGSPYAFHTQVWQDLNFTKYNLTQVYRQKDPDMAECLNQIREGRITKHTLDYINQCVRPLPDKNTLTITMTNKRAWDTNNKNLSELPGRKRVYKGVAKNFSERPVPEKLELKKGAKVIICANIRSTEDATEMVCVNGDTGIVTDLAKDFVVVKIDRTKKEQIIRAFDYIKEKNVTQTDAKGNPKLKRIEVGRYTQIPLRLFYATSTHKVQGQTVDKLHVDLEDYTFATGQAYVALSRVTSLAGLTLERPLRYNDVKVDKHVIDYLRSINFI